jgi:hypothetical protein
MNDSPPESAVDCPKCSEDISSSFVFCRACGHQILEETPAVEPQTQKVRGTSSRGFRGVPRASRLRLLRTISLGGVRPEEMLGIGGQRGSSGHQQVSTNRSQKRDGVKLVSPHALPSLGSFVFWGWILATILGLIALVANFRNNTGSPASPSTRETATQPASDPKGQPRKGGPAPTGRGAREQLLSRNQLAESFRSMLSAYGDCVSTQSEGGYFFGGASLDAKVWCFSPGNTQAGDWVDQNRQSLISANVAHVNLFYCADPYGKSCQLQYAIDVK